MLLIIDNQSSFIRRFKRQYLAENDINYVIFDHNQPLSLPSQSKIKGIILSGGRGNPYEPLNLTTNFVALMNYDVPVIGFCLGHEILAVAHMGRIKKLPEYHNRKEKIRITKTDDLLFRNFDKTEFMIVKQHYYHVSELPPSFVSLAESDTCQNEIIRHIDKPIYGFQGHPEVSGKDGLALVRNFFTICGINKANKQ